MKVKLGFVAVLGLLVAGLAACGSSSTTSGDSSTTPNITTVDALPRATSPVVSSSSGSISVAPKDISFKAATTGINLKNMSTDTFGTGNSMELCQAANQTREAVDAAAMADRILCYVQTIVANDTTGQLSTIYDGSYHIFGLSISGGDAGTPDHIKMKIIKTGSVVTGFEMFACGSGSQKEYLSQTISGNAVNMVAKGFWSGGSLAGGHQVEVTGNLNTSGYFTSKAISLAQYSGATLASPTQWSEASVTQYADKMVYNGYNKGTYGANSYQNRTYSQYQLIDPNSSASNSSYDVGLIAVGDGAANGIFGSGAWTATETKGWNGDTKLEDATVTIGTTGTTWLSQVESTTPAEAEAVPTIAFATDQSYNCLGTEEVEITGSETVLDAACSKFDLNPTHTWIDCYTEIQPD